MQISSRSVKSHAALDGDGSYLLIGVGDGILARGVEQQSRFPAATLVHGKSMS